ncbi:hypothetical protein Tco_0079096 [Tanacetum coccineum]
MVAFRHFRDAFSVVFGLSLTQDTVMSDSEDSTVTYTEVVLQAPPSPDYVPGPKEPEQAPPMPEFVPEPVYPEFMPPEDEEDPEEDDDEDSEEDPANYLADGGDDGDDEDESSDGDKDDDVDIKGDEEEEEEHPALADSTAVALLVVDHAPFAEKTEPFETDEYAATPPPHPTYRVTARILIRDEPPTPFWSDTEVARLLVIPTPPPSPLSPWSSPLPQIPSPPLPAPSTSHSPSPHIILSYTRADTPPSGTPPSGTPPLLPIPLPTSSPSLLLPSADHGADMLEVCLPPRKRLCFAFGPRYEVRESLSAPTARPTRGFRAYYGFVATMDREIMRDLERDVSYGITDTWEEMLVDMSGAPATDDTELGRRMTEFATRVREREARMSQEAWGRSMDTGDLARSEVMSLRTTILGQQTVITELQVADRRRQAMITELLAANRRRQAQFIEALKLLKRLQT